MGFGAIDYAVLTIYLLGVSALGFWFSKKQKDARDYFLGSRDLPPLAVALSIVATETSSLTFIGIPALAFGSDMTFLQITFGYFLARLVISFLFLPAYYSGEMYTAYTLLEHRFGNRLRKLASSLFLITRLLADGVRLFATAIPLAIITGFSYPTSIALICVFTLIYTYLGGIKAVIWLDVLQLIIYLTGVLLAMAALLKGIPGGWSEILAVGNATAKFKIFDSHFDLTTSYTIFSGFIGGCFLTMASHGTDQLMVQRLLTCRDLRGSQRALIGSGFLIILQFALFLLVGAMLFVFYHHFPERLHITRNDEIFPLFIVRELPQGISGIVIAAIFAAAMSTISSSMNSMASSIIMDLIKPVLKKSWTTAQELLFSRLATLGCAALFIMVAALAGSWGNVLEAGLKIASFTYGGLLGAFLLGLTNKSTHEKGAMVGLVAGLGTMLAVSLTPVAWPWYVLIGTTATYIVGSGASSIWRK